MNKDPFRNRGYIANFDELVGDYKVRSAATRAAVSMSQGLSYGVRPNEKLDLFFPKKSSGDAPLHLFIHGGYWRMFDKDDFSFIAETVTAAGAIAAIIDYDLMPDVRLGAIVAQVRNAVRWLAASIGTFGGNAKQFSVSGHSAGAHLATFVMSDGAASPHITSALLLSGIYDLKPLQSSFLQPLIGLTDKEVSEYSPLALRQSKTSNVIVAYGEHETEPFKNQAADFLHHLAEQGHGVTQHELQDRNHMSAVRDLGIPNSAAGKLLIDIIHAA